MKQVMGYRFMCAVYTPLIKNARIVHENQCKIHARSMTIIETRVLPSCAPPLFSLFSPELPRPFQTRHPKSIAWGTVPGTVRGTVPVRRRFGPRPPLPSLLIKTWGTVPGGLGTVLSVFFQICSGTMLNSRGTVFSVLCRRFFITN